MAAIGRFGHRSVRAQESGNLDLGPGLFPSFSVPGRKNFQPISNPETRHFSSVQIKFVALHLYNPAGPIQPIQFPGQLPSQIRDGDIDGPQFGLLL
jgi:hypothetical protein